MSKKTNSSKSKRQYKSASKPRLIALEPRMLFDGAAVATVVDANQDSQTALTNKTVPTIDDGSTSAAQVSTAADTPIAIGVSAAEDACAADVDPSSILGTALFVSAV